MASCVRTANSGSTWTRVDSKTGVALHALATPDGNTVVAAGGNKTTVLGTGTTLALSDSDPGYTSLLDVEANPINGAVAVIVGSKGTIRRTDRQWRNLDSNRIGHPGAAAVSGVNQQWHWMDCWK